jgi:hypothetical protein
METYWEQIDALCRTANAQARRVEELERRVADLEKRLAPASPCPSCGDTGILSDGETACTCPAAAFVIGPEDEMTVYPSAQAEDRAALKVA